SCISSLSHQKTTTASDQIPGRLANRSNVFSGRRERSHNVHDTQTVNTPCFHADYPDSMPVFTSLSFSNKRDLMPHWRKEIPSHHLAQQSTNPHLMTRPISKQNQYRHRLYPAQRKTSRRRSSYLSSVPMVYGHDIYEAIQQVIPHVWPANKHQIRLVHWQHPCHQELSPELCDHHSTEPVQNRDYGNIS